MEELNKLEPMLAKVGTINDLRRKYFVYELDRGGSRVLVYKTGDRIRLLNRKGMWIEFRYPELLEVHRFIDCRTAILDAQLVVLDAKGSPSNQALQEREHAASAIDIETLSRKEPATLVVFDMVMRDGRWLDGRPLFERKKALDETVRNNRIVKKSEWTRDGAGLFREAKRRKLEGVIAKNVNSRYEFGKRTGSWLKIKALKTIDCAVVGWKEGTGKRAGLFSELCLGIYRDLHLYFIGTVSRGITDEMAKIWMPRLHALQQKKPPIRNPPEGWQEQGLHWLKPSLVCEVEYEEFKGPEIKGASFVRMRSDKEPQMCTMKEQVRV